jgi:recombination protein RecT
LRVVLERYADKLTVFGVRADAYIEAALMAAVKTPELLKCTPESVALALRQCAQTGLEIGRTAHLVPFGAACTFVPDYKGLIELACATGKVASIRVRSVYEGEEFAYYEDIGGPVLKHVPRLSGAGGKIIGAYAIADLRFNRWKVEWMTAAEIDAIRTSKSKSWSRGDLVDWYARKTVVRKLCKTLPSNAKLQQALIHDDTEDPTLDGANEVASLPAPSGGYTLSRDYDDTDAPTRYDGNAVQVTEVTDLRKGVEAARAFAQTVDPMVEDAA